MGGKGLLALSVALTATLGGCERPPPFAGRQIDGPYYLTASILSPSAGRLICYRLQSGGCDARIAPPVVLLGWDEDFISAAIRPVGEPKTLRYFYIVRDFDGPRADIARVVRGPFDEKKFIEERRKHGVPGVFEIREAEAGAPQPRAD
ncbi:MAG: hypothetical protein ACOZAA_04815 [Pseudomonadota bacterium]